MIRLARASLLALLTFAVVLSACGSDDSASASDGNGYVGTVGGTDAFIAVVVSDDKVAVYACSGDEEIAEYFWGPVDDGLDDGSVPTLTSAGGATVDVALSDDGASGSITLPDGTLHEFTAAEAEGTAGLYLLSGDEAEASGLVGGWIIDNNGDQRGALLRSSTFEATPTLTDTGVSVDGSSAPVARIGVSGGKVAVTRVAAEPGLDLPDVVKAPSPAGPIPIPYPTTSK